MNERSAWRSLKADIARYREDSWLDGPWWIYERSIWAIVVYRLGQRMLELNSPLARRILGIPYSVLYSCAQIMTGIEIPPTTRIGPGMRIYHGNGLVINAGAVIGERVVLRQGVTIGARRVGGMEFPIIGDDVHFGAYTQVFGGVTVGTGARLGSMSVVLHDVPSGQTVFGAPARAVAPRAG